jgi:anti-sigma-K factor RskA
MNQQDPIFNLFRKNQHKLSERPSPQAWNRLERRLDQRGRRGTNNSASIYRLFFMVAAAIAMIFLVITAVDISQTATKKEAVTIPETTTKEKPVTRQYAMEQAFREQYQEQLSQSIEEGDAHRLIVVTKAVRPFLIPKKG